ncbi:MAG: putative metal-binding motif-containing protein, partial [Myxococcota bacterium]|nr:putative metal-binding motif-containing protein [Myxococcota bacterium]
AIDNDCDGETDEDLDGDLCPEGTLCSGLGGCIPEDGMSAEFAAPSCAAISSSWPATLPTASPQTGTYWLDPDADGAGAPFEAYCDFEVAPEGGGWTRMWLAEPGDDGTSAGTDWSPNPFATQGQIDQLLETSNEAMIAFEMGGAPLTEWARMPLPDAWRERNPVDTPGGYNIWTAAASPSGLYESVLLRYGRGDYGEAFAGPPTCSTPWTSSELVAQAHGRVCVVDTPFPYYTQFAASTLSDHCAASDATFPHDAEFACSARDARFAIYVRANLCDGDDSLCAVDLDDDGASALFDCDEGDETAYPLATELCDAIDNDCDGTIDEGADSDCAPNQLCSKVVDAPSEYCQTWPCTEVVGECIDMPGALPDLIASGASPGTSCQAIAHQWLSWIPWLPHPPNGTYWINPDNGSFDDPPAFQVG